MRITSYATKAHTAKPFCGSPSVVYSTCWCFLATSWQLCDYSK